MQGQGRMESQSIISLSRLALEALGQTGQGCPMPLFPQKNHFSLTMYPAWWPVIPMA